MEREWSREARKGGGRCQLLPSFVAQHVILAVTGSFNFGFSLAALNTSKDFICIDFRWCPDPLGKLGNRACDANKLYGSFTGVGVFLGAAIGCLLGGRLTKFGRRTAMLIMHGLLILGAILSAASEGFASLLVARLVVGLGVGLSTVCVPMFVSEVTPKQSRGFYGVFHQLFITLGIFIAVVLGLALGEAPPKDEFYQLTSFQTVWWRFMLAFPIIICGLAMLLFLTVYTSETPHYLVEKGDIGSAEAFLRKIYNTSDVSEVLEEITYSVQESRHMAEDALPVWTALADTTYRRVVLIGCVLSLFQQFTGINVLMANSNQLYEASGLSSDKTKLSVGMTAINVLMTFPPIFFADRLGRRTLMLIGTLGQAASLAPAMIANLVNCHTDAAHYISVASTFVYVVFFAIAYGPILWVYLHEIFPMEIKQGAAGLASSLNWVATIAMVLPSDFLLTDDPTVVFCIFTVMGVIAFLIVFFFMKETKGRSIDDSPYFQNKTRRIGKSFNRIETEGDGLTLKAGGNQGTSDSSWEARKLSRTMIDGRSGTAAEAAPPQGEV